MNWHAKFRAVLAIFDFSKKFRGRSCPQPFNYLTDFFTRDLEIFV